MPKFFNCFFWFVLVTGTSCHPYAALNQLEKEVFHQFPYQQYTGIWSRSDTLLYYKPEKISRSLEQIDAFRARLSLQGPTEKWPPEKLALHQELTQYLQDLQEHFSGFKTDPSIYNIGGRLVQTLNQAGLNTDEKSRLCLRHLEKASHYYRTARQCIESPDPERLHLAIRKQMAAMQLLEEVVSDSLKRWKLPPDQQIRFDKALYIANLSCKDYVAFCNSLLFEHREAGLFLKD